MLAAFSISQPTNADSEGDFQSGREKFTPIKKSQFLYI
jgi:hypothetical protein